MPITLSTTVNKPSEKIEDYIWLFGGEKKIGKTHFASQWPDSYTLEFEPGNAKHLSIRYNDVFSWEDSLEYITLIEKNLSHCKTLVIDDINSWYRLLIRYTRDRIFKLKDDEPMQIKHWDYPREQFFKLFQRIRFLNTAGVGIVLTNHIEIKTVQDLYGKEYSQLLLNFGNQPKEIIDAIAHFVGIMMRDTTGKRHLYLKGTSFVKCGHGWDNHFLNGETGETLAYIEMGGSAKEAYQNFVNAFNNQYIPPKPQVIAVNDDGQEVPKPLVTKTKPMIAK